MMSDARTLFQLASSSPYLFLVDIANLLSFAAIGYLICLITG
ncbi:hypothetical protein [Vibrio anguillarum]|nr:hypothetical protein [Vibrio anguillarum]